MPKNKSRNATKDAFAFAEELQKRNKRLANLANQNPKSSPDVCPMCRRKMK